MDGILDVLLRGMDIVERLRNVSTVSGIQLILFGVLLVFGIVNCVLGYRLLRFWMMLFGFILGSGFGFGASFFMGIEDNTVRIAVTAAVGIVLAVIVFISYKAGIFVMGAGLGIGIAVYVLHPTSSLVFFICLLAGAGLGSLAMKWAREVIIVGTSLLGGAMAGMSLAKLGGLADFPYGIGLSAGFAALGMLIQFATNRVKYEEPEEYEEPVLRKKKIQNEQRTYKGESRGYEEIPVRRKKSPAPSENRRYFQQGHVSSEQRRRSRIPVDLQVGDEDIYADYPIESEKTIVYRPRRRPDPEFDLPLDSYAYDDSYGRRPYPKNSSKKQTYTVRMNAEAPVKKQSGKAQREFYADLDKNPSRKKAHYKKFPYEEDFDEEDFYEDDLDDLYEDDLYGEDFDEDDLYDEPIDEEELEDEIIREMMEDDDRESILPWKNKREKKSRKEGRSGKRS